jgi:hypothetical protein
MVGTRLNAILFGRITPPKAPWAHVVFVIAHLSLIVACTPALDTAVASSPPPPAPTGSPIPTVTPAVTATFAPLTEATKPIVLAPSGDLVSPTVPPQPPVNLPDNPIALFEPGPGSQVVSPFRVVGRAGPSFQERVIVRLYGEQGQMLHEKTTVLFAFPGNAGRFVTILAFETEMVAEAGKIQIDTPDPRYGRLAHRFTEEVVLLANGPGKLRPGHQSPAQLTVLEPRQGEVVPNGGLIVKGGGWSYGGGPLLLQAWDHSGEVIDSAPLELSNGLKGAIGVFEAELQIQVSASGYGRLAVMEMDPETGQPAYLNSTEVYFQR